MAEDKTKDEAAKVKPSKPVKRKKRLKSLSYALIHITCSFNNTIVTITDEKGDTIAWHTSGACGFKGTKKGTPFAAQMTTSRAVGKVMDMGIKQAAILVNGPGPGRETAIRAVEATGIKVVSIKDVTPLPHNGCRPPKARRV
jgi:small subunit ribosomal protein S11